MVAINASREVSAPIDRVWDVISDIDNEPQYWHGTKSVKNISRNGNIIEREVIISFKDSRCHQTVILKPKKSVEITITDGAMEAIITIANSVFSAILIGITGVWVYFLTYMIKSFKLSPRLELFNKAVGKLSRLP